MTLFVQQIGSGPDLVMLHGWGLHSGLWGEFAGQLARHFRLSLVDLPGHGRSQPYSRPLTLDSAVDDIAQALVPLLERPAVVLGWSLGSLIALGLASHHSDRFLKLVWIAGTPSFVARSDWPAGMAADTLAGFADGLQHDYRATLKRFISLNGGKGGDRQLLRNMQDNIFDRGEPSPQTLQQGLAMLRDCDLRDSLSSLVHPLLVIQGSHDRLVHPDTIESIRLLHEADVVQLDGAGHAPFLNEPQRVARAIVEFAK